MCIIECCEWLIWMLIGDVSTTVARSAEDSSVLSLDWSNGSLLWIKTLSFRDSDEATR